MKTKNRTVDLSGSAIAASRGFTLLEVLIAIVLTSAILGAVYATFSMVDMAKEGASESLLRLYEAQKAVDMMKKEVESVKGPLTVTDKEFLGKQTSSLAFNCLSPKRGIISAVSYALVNAEDGKFNLSKSAQLPGGPIANAVLLEDVQEFTVEAKGIDGKWVKTWSGANPAEIRLMLKIPFKDRSLTLTEVAKPRIGNPL
jgi:prepilin-type N-terminal cleavage/methylation domain-containing protein